MKTVELSIKGTAPILIHAWPLVPVEHQDKLSATELCEHHVYRDPVSRNLVFPALNVQRAIISGAAYSKGKRGSSLSKLVAAGVRVSPERCDFGVQEYAVDSRSVVIRATKGRIVRHRARLDAWGLKFSIEYDDTLLTEEQLRRCVDDTGKRVGIGDFRPECKGPFGTFMVNQWE